MSTVGLNWWEHEFNALTPTWTTVKAYAEHELEMARRKLEKPGTTHSESDVLRGRIAALQAIIALPEALNRERSLDRSKAERAGADPYR